MILRVILFLLLSIGAAHAQTTCQVQSQPTLLSTFSDNAGASSITPHNMRNVICSTYGTKLPTGPNLSIQVNNGGAFLGTANATVDSSGNMSLAGFLTFGAGLAGPTTTQIPCPGWSAVNHQDLGGYNQGHCLTFADQNTVFTADKFAVVTPDPVQLWQFGCCAGSFTVGHQIGFQFTVANVMYPVYITVPSAPATTKVTRLLAAAINGGIMTATIANAGTNAVNNHTYTLVGTGCGAAPTVTLTAALGVASAAAVANSAPITGGWCVTTLSGSPYALAGTNTTVTVTQSAQGVAFQQALSAYIDATGIALPNHSTAVNGVGSTITTFDYPAVSTINGNSIAVCSGTQAPGSTIPVGVSCPNAGSYTEGIGLTLQAGLDIDPNIICLRNNSGYAPIGGSDICSVLFPGVVSTTGATTQYGGISALIGDAGLAKATSAGSGGTSITVDTIASFATNYYIHDTSGPWLISEPCTVASATPTSGGAGTVVVNAPCVLNNGSGDFLSSTNPAGGLGVVIIEAANYLSAPNQAGTELIISGAPADSGGAAVQILESLPSGNTELQITNPNTGAGVIASWQLVTNTPCVTGIGFCGIVSGQLQDNNGAPYYTETALQSIRSYNINLTDAVDSVAYRVGYSNISLGSGTPWFTIKNTAGAQFTGTISGTALTASAETGNAIAIGQMVTSAGIASGTLIVGGSDPNWVVTPSQTFGPASMVSGTPVANFSTGITFGVPLGQSLTVQPGEVGLFTISATGIAPGAHGGKLELVCGTNSGTAKLIAYAGTSGTPVTVVDNVGASVSGC